MIDAQYDYLKAEPLNIKAALQNIAGHHVKTHTQKNATEELLDAYHGLLSELEEATLRIAQLEQLCTTDELTGLKNRRGLLEGFERELDRADRGLSAGGMMIMIDLDNFKSINDTYGHAAGDAALQCVANSLSQQIRSMDIAARLGGDEFVLLFANAHQTKTLGRAQKIALMLGSLTMRWQGHDIPIRASLGIKHYNPGDKAHDILEAADSTMYEAKNSKKS